MLRRKKDKRQDVPANDWTDKAAGKIVGAGTRLQSVFAASMSKVFAGMNTGKLKAIFFVFFFAGMGGSLYLVLYGVFASDRKQPSFQVTPIEVPKYYDRMGEVTTEPNTAINEELYQEIQAYKKHMDSTGEAIRPGLRDSIALIEGIYESQKIK